jgi:hypothetical protein
VPHLAMQGRRVWKPTRPICAQDLDMANIGPRTTDSPH